MRCGAGCGGREGAQDVRRVAEAQAAAIRPTGRGSPAEDIKGMPGPGRLSSGVVAEQAPHPARGTPEISAFRGDCNLVWPTHIAARGRGQAESPAFRAPLRIGFTRCATRRKGNGLGLKANPAPQTIRAITRASLALFGGHGYISAAFPRHCVAERPRRGDAVLPPTGNHE